MASNNIKPGTYNFKDPEGHRIGTVHVNANGDWAYLGDKDGSNSGTIKDKGYDSQFIDHKGKPVGSWSPVQTGGGIHWTDPEGAVHYGTLTPKKH